MVYVEHGRNCLLKLISSCNSLKSLFFSHLDWMMIAIRMELVRIP